MLQLKSFENVRMYFKERQYTFGGRKFMQRQEAKAFYYILNEFMYEKVATFTLWQIWLCEL